MRYLRFSYAVHGPWTGLRKESDKTGDGNMTEKTAGEDDINLLREIQRNTEKNLFALENLAGKVYDDSFALMLTRESFKYGELHDRAKAQLLAASRRPEPENKVDRLIQSASLNAGTLMNTTTSRLAEMMIRTSSDGLSSLWRAMNHNAGAGEKSTELARELMDFEENNIRELKKYL